MRPALYLIDLIDKIISTDPWDDEGDDDEKHDDPKDNS